MKRGKKKQYRSQMTVRHRAAHALLPPPDDLSFARPVPTTARIVRLQVDVTVEEWFGRGRCF